MQHLERSCGWESTRRAGPDRIPQSKQTARWDVAGPGATLVPALAHTTDPAVHQQARHPSVTSLAFAP